MSFNLLGNVGNNNQQQNQQQNQKQNQPQLHPAQKIRLMSDKEFSDFMNSNQTINGMSKFDSFWATTNVEHKRFQMKKKQDFPNGVGR